MAGRRTIWAAMLVAGAAASGPASAQMPGTGCWVNDTPTFVMRVCVSDGVGKDLELRWDEPASHDMPASHGYCMGSVEVTDGPPPTFTMTVPRRDDGCVQDGETVRLALRTYDCQWQDTDRFSCYETIYYDDGSVFGESSDVLFERFSEAPAE